MIYLLTKFEAEFDYTVQELNSNVERDALSNCPKFDKNTLRVKVHSFSIVDLVLVCSWLR